VRNLSPAEIQKAMANSIEKSLAAADANPIKWWSSTHEPTCLSNWFPKVEAAGLPVPKTIIVRAVEEEIKDFYNVFDGKPLGPTAFDLVARVKAAADEIGYPCFLRTGLTSGKHNWENACYLKSSDDIPRLLIGLMEFSSIHDLGCNIYAVRKFLSTSPVAVLPAYSNMPLCREFRCFAEKGEVKCIHPYWPLGAVIDGFKYANVEYNEDYLKNLVEELNTLHDDEKEIITDLAARTSLCVDGEWSIDILQCKNGWYVTDMAVGALSFHWEECSRIA